LIWQAAKDRKLQNPPESSFAKVYKSTKVYSLWDKSSRLSTRHQQQERCRLYLHTETANWPLCWNNQLEEIPIALWSPVSIQPWRTSNNLSKLSPMQPWHRISATFPP